MFGAGTFVPMKTEVTPEKIMAFRAATGLTMSESKEFLARHPTDLIHRILSAAAAGVTLPDVNALAAVAPDLRDRIFRAAEVPERSSFLTDPLENDPEVGAIIRRILDETTAVVRREMGGTRQLGSCHRIWRLTKERLLKDHGITWYSPAEMNPGSCFD